MQLEITANTVVSDSVSKSNPIDEPGAVVDKPKSRCKKRKIRTGKKFKSSAN